ncbi:TetR/AcrR family transcriptional regulator [Enterococcus hermanniensis]|uniref:TetR/AcrR family transcriptional regulator n=1 Tax=Enterococcus hermanniensis TaxID=249189 RepID=UPI0008FFE6B4|nr:TetR/AcrR family transcriptional regulator [Enterococcus hermanniensis]
MRKNVGRPRNKEVDEKILSAVRELLTQNSPDKLSIEGIAEYAQVGKASIYRRYAGKDELILAALADAKSMDLTNLSLDASPLAIISEIVTRFLTTYNNPTGRRMIMMAVNTTTSSDKLSKAYWDIHAIPQIEDLAALLENLQTQKKLSPNIDPKIAAETLISVFTAQFLLRPQEEVAGALTPILEQLFSTWE